ncbi:calmodulin-alpha-like [Bolinopsis microptera]|uniref:calmodulin-alpha-like n=1 Tax=Bolinopsis microptera TaxID=2820187 RepID=UPI00307ACE11
MDFNPSTLTKEEETEMKNMFITYDIDANGSLELDELQKMFASFNVIALKEDLKAFFEKVDTDQDGTVDFDELMLYIEEIMAEQPNSDDIMDAFNLIDADGNGEVSHEEVAVAMQKADVGILTKDIIYLLEEADLNTDGKISFSEFRSLIYGL